jgi:hypothetical protein
MLNVAAEARRELVVEAPFIGVALLRYDAKTGTITHGIQRNDYAIARNKVLPGSTPFENEIPVWPGIAQALLSSGAVAHANSSHMQEFLADLEMMAGDPGRPKLIHLAFDTNILYKRWPSRRIHRLLANDKPLLRFALSAGVKEELDARAKAKFGDPDEVKAFARTVGGSKAMAVQNRAKRANRLASSALGEYELLAKTRRTSVLTCVELSSDKEENDRKIAASYANLDARPDAEVTLVTADSGMLTHAHVYGLQSELLEDAKPDRIPPGAMDEDTLLHLVHDLATQCLLLHLQPCDVWVWSDWHGKRIGDWAAERLRLEYDPSNAMAAAFVRDLEAVRAVLEAERRPTFGAKVKALGEAIKEAVAR